MRGLHAPPRTCRMRVYVRAAVYARVSTRDKQDTATQLYPLRDYAEKNGHTVVHEWVDIGFSGSKHSRPGLDAMMAAARRREFDVLIVARFDRFGRSVSHLVRSLEEFNALGIHFISIGEQIDTNSVAGRLVFHILCAIAEFERSIIKLRVQAGVDRARRQGKRLGRPPKQLYDRVRVIELITSGRSVKSVAKEMGISRPTVDKVMGVHRAEKLSDTGCRNPVSAAHLSD